MKKYFEYFAQKQGLRVVTIVIVILLGCAFFLSVVSGREIKRMINEDFNQQQLQLARHAAGTLAEDWKIVKRELITLSLSPSIQYVKAVSWANRMKISLSSLTDYCVIRIMLVNADGTDSYSVDYSNAISTEVGDYFSQDYFKWCRKPENNRQVYISDVTQAVVEHSEPGLVAFMATPVYQVSTDEAHPKPTDSFSGVLVFFLDVGSLAKKFVGPIRSGKTGYAWVIDESGRFLYHLERDFVGQNAFEARRFKDPHISFKKINLIQKTKMLNGEEGTSRYISGWHRGVTGSMEKLIAYAPVPMAAANATRIWSVAVVAPASEVEEAVHSVYVRQSFIHGAFTIAVLVIFAFLIINERAWLRTLEQEVKEKTKDLAAYAERLERSERRYRSLIESADDMIYTIDKQCNILSVNQYGTRLAGGRPEDVIGKNIMDVIEYQNPRHVLSVVERVLTTSDTITHEESVKIGDRQYYLSSKYQPILTDSDYVGAVLVISRDITEHKKIEDQLFHTEKLASLGSLSAGVAHEINNPIAVILGFTEILGGTFPEGSKEHEIVKTIERQGNNCKRIVENLLAFAKVPKKTTTETDVVDALQNVISVVANTLLTKKVDLKTQFQEKLPMVGGDGPQLEQVFMNIINNAVAAMDGGGVLTILAHRSNDMVSIAFRDTGHGISPEHTDKIFEPFFTTKKVGEGTGLGLSVSYGIVKKFGGDIQVKSQTKAEGKNPGTTFTVTLPVVDV